WGLWVVKVLYTERCVRFLSCVCVTERPGMCPVSLVGEEGPCGELCVSDFECSDLEKCCSSICGGRTFIPSPGHLGMIDS
uniref:WAP domain-containing protein n=1 Tax=Cyprinus carpio TaxID=7962 RepID=A0A8C2HF64_CYPCA